MDIYTKDQYFEAILQLRPENKKVLEFVKNQLQNSKTKISKEVKEKYGLDLYLTSQRFAIALGRKLKRRFKEGEIKISRSLHTRDKLTSKLVYRVTVLFRLEDKE